MNLSAAAIISQAEAFDIQLVVHGDKLRCGSSAAMPPALRDLLRERKPALVKELERRAAMAGIEPSTSSTEKGCRARPGAPEPASQVTPPAPAPRTKPPTEHSKPPMCQAPTAISRVLAEALDAAARHHVRFWLDETGILVTQPPQDYKREVQAAERALMCARDEISHICKLPERPKGYEDQAWVRAVVDSARLGYRNWREEGLDNG